MASKIAGCQNFNPRSPHGERPGVFPDNPHDILFQSTLPARGATHICLRSFGSAPISIHAPRTGSDRVTALAAIDRADSVAGRVVYLGSFTKMIYPGFNLGYLVAPSVEVARAFEGAKLLFDRHTSEVHQAILTEFIGGGHYDAHIRRLKRLYEKRRAAAVRAIGRFCSGFGRLIPSNQGTHLTFLFHDPKLSDVEVSERLRKEHRIETRALSLCYQEAPVQNGLLLGFAGFTESEIETAVRKMALAIEAMRTRR